MVLHIELDKYNFFPSDLVQGKIHLDVDTDRILDLLDEDGDDTGAGAGGASMRSSSMRKSGGSSSKRRKTIELDAIAEGWKNVKSICISVRGVEETRFYQKAEGVGE